MGRLSKNDRQYAVGNPNKMRKRMCPVCHGIPCDGPECKTPQAKRDANLVARHGGLDGGKDKKKTTPKVSKAQYVKNLKKAKPGISDADIKKSLKAAGYPVSFWGKY